MNMRKMESIDFAPEKCDHGKDSIFDCLQCLDETLDLWQLYKEMNKLDEN